MALLFADQRELLLPLVDGIEERPPWRLFLRNLVARTYARQAALIVSIGGAASPQPPSVVHAAAPRAVEEPPFDAQALADLGLKPLGDVRAGRVYALDELLNFDHRTELARQRAQLAGMNIRYGRLLRVSAGETVNAWIFLVRRHEDFTASDGAILSALAPHIEAALRLLVAIGMQRLNAATAHRALARLGVGQIAFDVAGRVIAADPLAQEILAAQLETDPSRGRRLGLLPEAGRQLEVACLAMARDRNSACRLIRIDEVRAIDMLLQPADLPFIEPQLRPAAIGTIRIARREDPANATRILADLHGLSEREAAIAHGLTMGETIVGAGARLHLTSETARNYSKRIYGKAGVTGQADLVRLILTGLTPLA
jgi:DNA-binding CsgD family transcriptional regulator